MLCLKTCQELFYKFLANSQIFRFNPFSLFIEKCIQKNFKILFDQTEAHVVSLLDKCILTFTLILIQIYNEKI